jgi:hypothetical protein
MEEKKVGTLKFTADGLRDLAAAIDNTYTKKNQVICMEIWRGDDGLYMQLGEGTGFINLIKDKQQLKLV